MNEAFEFLFETKLLGFAVIELVAAGLGLVSVWLTVRQNILCWPVGIVNVALYAVIFTATRLYADAGLQVFFFVMQFYGWYEWLYGGERRTVLPVSSASWTVLLVVGLLGTCGTAALAVTLLTWTNQDFPYFDSAIAVFSLAAQWMMARKLIENWLVWIGVDTVAVGVYWVKGLQPTAVLYAIYLVLAALGYWQWRRAVRGADLVRH